MKKSIYIYIYNTREVPARMSMPVPVTRCLLMRASQLLHKLQNQNLFSTEMTLHSFFAYIYTYVCVNICRPIQTQQHKNVRAHEAVREKERVREREIEIEIEIERERERESEKESEREREEREREERERETKTERERESESESESESERERDRAREGRREGGRERERER